MMNCITDKSLGPNQKSLAILKLLKCQWQTVT